MSTERLRIAPYETLRYSVRALRESAPDNLMTLYEQYSQNLGDLSRSLEASGLFPRGSSPRTPGADATSGGILATLRAAHVEHEHWTRCSEFLFKVLSKLDDPRSKEFVRNVKANLKRAPLLAVPIPI